MYVGVLLVCISMHHVLACYMWKPEEDVGSPGTRVTDALSHCVGAGDLLQALWKSS